MKYKFVVNLVIIISLFISQIQLLGSGIGANNKVAGTPLYPIDFSDIKQLKTQYPNNIITIPPDPKEKLSLREIILPEFEKYCHVAADSNMFRWIGASNRMFPWVGKKDLTSIFVPKKPIPPRIPMPNKRALLMMFELSDGRYLTIMPLSGKASVSWLETDSEGKLTVDYGTLGTGHVSDDEKIPLLAWAIGKNVYESVSQVWSNLAGSYFYRDKMSLRFQKKYPEPMKYLGWCTWEQYHKNIHEEIILDAIENIEKSGIPVRWLLIDDGHQTLKDGQMLSMQPDQNKFPRGWQPIIERKKNDKIKWMGIWHTLLMYWNNISPDHEMDELAPYLMPKPVKGMNEPTDNVHVKKAETNVKALIPKDDLVNSEKFYMHFMKTVRDQGFNFIKTDNVSRSIIEYYGTENPVRAQSNNVLSLEKACKKNKLGLMNCSAQNTINMLNATNSATMRTSPDYQKNKLETSRSQILQSVFNVLWIGQTLWPDHDMFHSSDSQVAETMAVTKAMSGGPIYLSDAPEDFDKEIIMPLCYDDGLLIRPEAPGVPLPESIFSDALYEEKNLYKVIAPLKNSSCAIAVYNLSIKDNTTLSGKITPSDYTYSNVMIQPFEEKWKISDEGLVIYNWKTKTGKKLEEKGVDLKIDGFGHELFLLCPITAGWSVIGLKGKFLGPSTVEVLKVKERFVEIALHEAGNMVLFSEKGLPKSDQMNFKSLGNNFYEGQVLKSTPSNKYKIYLDEE